MGNENRSGRTGQPERAVVTGATSGIGRAIAARLARRGAIVGILGRDANRAETVAAEVRSAGGVPWVARVDVTDPQNVSDAVAGFVAQFGGIETAVAAAGIALTGPITSIPLSEWHQVINTNLNGVYYLARVVIPELVKTRGTLTVISSDAGVQGAPGYGAYCASKHGISGLVKVLALDYGPLGVRCNAVCPGFVETPMAEQLLKDATAEEVEFYKRSVPLGRFAQPAEVAEVVAHLSSDAASYTNGLMYRLEGGATAGYFVAPAQ